ncbi:MAG: hypothetical protein ACE5GX_05450 [Thermoanaerobaculia bacterium]
MSTTKKVLLVVGSAFGICVLCWVLVVGAVYAWGGVMTVKVDNPNGPNLNIPVPMAVVDAALATSEIALEEVRIEIGEYGPMLAAMMEVIEDCPDVTFVEVEDRGDHVRVFKEDGYIKVEVNERGHHGVNVRVSIPARFASRTVARLVG